MSYTAAQLNTLCSQIATNQIGGLLNLDNQGLDNVELSQVITALQNNTLVTGLGFANNGLNNGGALSLAGLLSTNRNIIFVDVSGNAVSNTATLNQINGYVSRNIALASTTIAPTIPPTSVNATASSTPPKLTSTPTVAPTFPQTSANATASSAPPTFTSTPTVAPTLPSIFTNASLTSVPPTRAPSITSQSSQIGSTRINNNVTATFFSSTPTPLPQNQSISMAPNNSQIASSSRASTSSGMIIGLSVGGIALGIVGVIILIAYLYRRYHPENPPEHLESNELGMIENPIHEDTTDSDFDEDLTASAPGFMETDFSASHARKQGARWDPAIYEGSNQPDGDWDEDVYTTEHESTKDKKRHVTKKPSVKSKDHWDENVYTTEHEAAHTNKKPKAHAQIPWDSTVYSTENPPASPHYDVPSFSASPAAPGNEEVSVKDPDTARKASPKQVPHHKRKDGFFDKDDAKERKHRRNQSTSDSGTYTPPDMGSSSM